MYFQAFLFIIVVSWIFPMAVVNAQEETTELELQCVPIDWEQLRRDDPHFDDNIATYNNGGWRRAAHGADDLLFAQGSALSHLSGRYYENEDTPSTGLFL